MQKTEQSTSFGEKNQTTTQESKQDRTKIGRSKYDTYASTWLIKDVLHLSLLNDVGETNTKLD